MYNADDILILGRTNWRNENKPFGILPEDRARHMYIIGQTGAGKSTLLLNMIAQDAAAGRGFAVFDPHGDMVERVLDLIPPRRINETVYFNPADTEWPIAINALDYSDQRRRHLAASGLVLVFKKIWAEFWGPRLEYVLRNAILALLENPGQTLLGIPRLLIDDVYRARMLRHVKDPVVRNYWAYEYELYPKTFRMETISPILNKAGQFLSTPLVRNIVGQPKTKFDLRQIMDRKGILLVNLAKGKIGEDNTALLGALVLARLQLAALSRADKLESKRLPFAAYIDEFPSIVTDGFADMLSESRKYGLQLVLAHQYIEQLTVQLRAAVFGNVGTTVCFRVGPWDATFLRIRTGLTYSVNDLTELPGHDMYTWLSIKGRTTSPFSAHSEAPPSVDMQAGIRIIAQSRLRHTAPKRDVEKRLAGWLATIM